MLGQCIQGKCKLVQGFLFVFPVASQAPFALACQNGLNAVGGVSVIRSAGRMLRSRFAITFIPCAYNLHLYYINCRWSIQL